MKNLKKPLLIIAILLASTQAIANALDALDEDQAKIITNIQSMWQAVEENDLDRYLEFIHSDYTVFGESDAYLHEGKDKEEIDYRDFLSRAKGVRTFMHQPKVNVRGDTA